MINDAVTRRQTFKREFSEVKSNELTNTVQKKKTKLKSALELGLEL